jgi:hypothetical protein
LQGIEIGDKSLTGKVMIQETALSFLIPELHGEEFRIMVSIF